MTFSINPVAFTLGSIQVRWYGIILAAAIVIACILGVRLAKRRGFKSDLVFDMLLIALPLAIIGARLYYVIPEWSRYADNPISILYIWEGGLGLYGALIGAAVGIFIFSRWRKVSMLTLLDIVAPCFILAQAIGRWANFINQEAYGQPVFDPLWQWFPASVYIEHPVTINPSTGLAFAPGWFMATFFYESMWNLLGFFALYFFFKNSKRRGNVFALYLVIYGIGRAIIENFRTDSLWWGPMRASVVVSIVFVIIGLLYIFWWSKLIKPLPEYAGKYSFDYVEPKDGKTTIITADDDETVTEEELMRRLREKYAAKKPQPVKPKVNTKGVKLYARRNLGVRGWIDTGIGKLK